ncbi:Stk1 family PASTA domain-containing Ser/Thr kinase [Natronoglycomyces albus]|uniref:non-specific serine/threonine protein kinase n=1 Tax=Natronoglycomyces albus TaxID=2811108 RepID=A0A895XQM3_9ACTN|nr:Stk1 family PASTA domain-containing Ser/Thr kinase [Natronoglycomyces albus]QSB05669.1 Stk1 family PASTA domain-containing Ser/Thr kinase [Natronoglycomyces albus]
MTAQPRLVGGRYEIGDVLGYGGMAEVHHARDRRLGRDVAVKLLRSDLARDESFLIRFQREAQNSASLNHPNIVAVFDTGEEGGVPYMVMEYVPGRTLKEVLIAEGPFDADRACNVVADMSSALDFSHKHQIIHRDVKPGNVMLSESGQVKVMDFGIARAMASGQATMTQTSAVIGTAQYLSPEQARGETVDARSDVYATGCVLYELLVGHPPFTGDNPVSVAYQHVRETPKPPSELNPDVPPEVDAVVMKALAKNPENRYQSAGEMREDLQRAAIGAAVHAPMVMGEDERTQLLNATPDATGPLTPIEPENSKKKGWLIFLGIVLALLLTAGAAWAAWQLMDEPLDLVEIPDVVGDEESVAVDALEDLDFVVDVERTPADDPDDPNIGLVIDQDPAGGLEEERGTVITLEVMTDPDSIELNDLSNFTNCDAALGWLTDNNLNGECEEQSDSSASGTIIGQDPSPGTPMQPGDTVTIYVSSGDQQEVPDVIGDTTDAALGRLGDRGFSVSQSQSSDCDESDDGRIISQDPSGGSTVSRGSNVAIVTCAYVNDEPTETPTDDEEDDDEDDDEDDNNGDDRIGIVNRSNVPLT